MSKPLLKNDLLVVIMMFLFFTAALGSFYVYMVKPMKEEVLSLQLELQHEEAILSSLGESVNNLHEGTEGTTVELQKRLPVEPLIDQFILELEQAEAVSNSFITSINFGNGVLQQTGDTIESFIETEAEDSETENNDEESAFTETTPVGIEKVTAELIVESPSYFELESFILALEGLQRITKIDELVFSGSTNNVGGTERMVYEVTVSTFYYPQLTQIRHELPKIEAPPPSLKKNPVFPSKP